MVAELWVQTRAKPRELQQGRLGWEIPFAQKTFLRHLMESEFRREDLEREQTRPEQDRPCLKWEKELDQTR